MRPWFYFGFGSTEKNHSTVPCQGGQIDHGKTDVQQLQDTLSGRVTRVGNVAMAITSSTADLFASMTTTVDRAKQVAEAVSKVEAHTASLATSIEEMTVTVREIAGSTTAGARTASETVAAAKDAQSAMQRLGESSAGIGDVVKTIAAIASQTNLLALNATIEAARAGDAGRGFAVVASEVKALAQQTAQATADIGTRIAAIQTDSARAIAAIVSISEHINHLSENGHTVASAVEEQVATTAEVSHSVTATAQEAAKIAADIRAVANAAYLALGGVMTVKDLGEDITTQSQAIQRLVVRAHPGESIAGAPRIAADLVDRAIRAHIHWRTRLMSAINGGEVPDRARACDHTACDLGKWLSSQDQSVRLHPTFAQLVEQHQLFHAAVGKTIDLVIAKRLEDARQDLVRGEIPELSLQVVGLLNELRQEPPGSAATHG